MGKYDAPPTIDELRPMAEIKEYEDHFNFMVNESKYIVSDTPEKLWVNAIAYIKWSKDNPITSKRKQLTGKSAGTDIVIEYQRPLTIKGLCLHCNITEEYIMDVKSSKDKTNEFYIVIMKILYAIYTQNAEGAMVGIYESGFTARLLNMEKEDAPTAYVKVEHINNVPYLAESENEISKKLELEMRGELGEE